MEQINYTAVTYFIIKGISDRPELQAPIFLLILLIYLICLGGNTMILLLVFLDPQLRTPMYFFLSNLSLIDICSTTVNLHKILFIFISGDNTTSFICCMIQMYMFISLQTTVFLILAAMGYDRYVAICNPLHYQMVMNRKICLILATFSWVMGCMEATPTLLGILSFTCYKSNIINHFFCDAMPLKKLICSDTTFVDLYILIDGGLIACFTPFSLTLVSYIFIINTIMRINSSTGRRKAFYTCSSHLIVVILLYTTVFCQYLTPKSMDNLESKKIFSLFNTAVVPILNPMIYSLKNKDVKSSVRRLLKSRKLSF
ncbi:olfactory receptor 5M11-like [Bombina bombina]|uniref:olfactory receptor 5M11-like n=1 Tax=Bombina bombina TaxID=8345 RepID=UPI00235A4A70|nr:olfactory receptor 5M11-like [Bombina bombina]